MRIPAVIAATLLTAACGGDKAATDNATVANAAVTEMSEADALEGTTNDSMTNFDAATGAVDEAAINGSGNASNASE